MPLVCVEPEQLTFIVILAIKKSECDRNDEADRKAQRKYGEREAPERNAQPRTAVRTDGCVLAYRQRAAWAGSHQASLFALDRCCGRCLTLWS